MMLLNPAHESPPIVRGIAGVAGGRGKRHLKVGLTVGGNAVKGRLILKNNTGRNLRAETADQTKA